MIKVTGTVLAICICLLSSTVFAQTDCKKTVVQEGRDEPKYVGLTGYTVASRFGFRSNYDKELPKTPWNIQVLEQTGPNLWEKSSKTIPTKMLVNVNKQVLSHKGWGNYEGYLVISVVGTKKTFHIDPSNFSPVAYWKCKPVDAIKYSSFIAIVKKGQIPVDRDGKWEEVGTQRKVYCTEAKPYPQLQILCYVYKKWKYGYGGVGLYFKPSQIDLFY
jgi:hypothetical protein